MVHELQDGLDVSVLDAPQVEQWVLVRVPPKHVSEERRTGGENQLVCLDLIVITGQSHVEQFLVLADRLEGDTDIAFKVIPFEAEFF